MFLLLLFYAYFLFLCCLCCTIGLGENRVHVGNGPISGPKREDSAEVPLTGLSHKISLE